MDIHENFSAQLQKFRVSFCLCLYIYILSRTKISLGTSEMCEWKSGLRQTSSSEKLAFESEPNSLIAMFISLKSKD